MSLAKLIKLVSSVVPRKSVKKTGICYMNRKIRLAPLTIHYRIGGTSKSKHFPKNMGEYNDSFKRNMNEY